VKTLTNSGGTIAYSGLKSRQLRSRGMGDKKALWVKKTRSCLRVYRGGKMRGETETRPVWGQKSKSKR